MHHIVHDIANHNGLHESFDQSWGAATLAWLGPSSCFCFFEYLWDIFPPRCLKCFWLHTLHMYINIGVLLYNIRYRICQGLCSCPCLYSEYINAILTCLRQAALHHIHTNNKIFAEKKYDIKCYSLPACKSCMFCHIPNSCAYIYAANPQMILLTPFCRYRQCHDAGRCPNGIWFLSVRTQFWNIRNAINVDAHAANTLFTSHNCFLSFCWLPIPKQSLPVICLPTSLILAALSLVLGVLVLWLCV